MSPTASWMTKLRVYSSSAVVNSGPLAPCSMLSQIASDVSTLVEGLGFRIYGLRVKV